MNKNININYIGSKNNLLEFIEKTIQSDIEATDKIFLDLFSGSGVVARHFRKKGMIVKANDVEPVSILSLEVLIHQDKTNNFYLLGGEKRVFKYLNKISLVSGFFTKNFSPEEKKYSRKYFTVENAKKIDAIRSKLEFWKKWKIINKSEYKYLLFCLVKAVEKSANTAAIYEAYLKEFKKSALKPLVISPIEIDNKFIKGHVYKSLAEELILDIEGDILYLDPPYNRRQYSSNYHILNTLILNDKPILKGKTGNRSNNFKSKWCSKTYAKSELEHIMKHAKFKKIYMSYNSEGIISIEEIKKIFSKYGEYRLHKKKYRRFKSNKIKGEKHVYEYIHVCIKD